MSSTKSLTRELPKQLDGALLKSSSHPAIIAGITFSSIASAANERLSLPFFFTLLFVLQGLDGGVDGRGETAGQLGAGDDEMREGSGVLGANPGG